jgi:hypothetical protein
VIQFREPPSDVIQFREPPSLIIKNKVLIITNNTENVGG